MTSGSRDSLAKTIAAQESKLLELDRGREDVRLRLERLRTDLVALDSAAAEQVGAPPTSDAASAMTSAKKVMLFRSFSRPGPRELPAGYEGVPDDPIIEWDEGALSTFKDSI